MSIKRKSRRQRGFVSSGNSNVKDAVHRYSEIIINAIIIVIMQEHQYVCTNQRTINLQLKNSITEPINSHQSKYVKFSSILHFLVQTTRFKTSLYFIPCIYYRLLHSIVIRTIDQMFNESIMMNTSNVNTERSVGISEATSNFRYITYIAPSIYRQYSCQCRRRKQREQRGAYHYCRYCSQTRYILNSKLDVREFDCSLLSSVLCLICIRINIIVYTHIHPCLSVNHFHRT